MQIRIQIDTIKNMDILNILSILITLAALFAYINYRYIKLPTTIGIMLISLVISACLIIAGKLGLESLFAYAETILGSIDFHQTLMNGMLSFLLFAGALHINLKDLAEQKWLVLSLATFGVVVSTFLVGGLTWLVLSAFGLHVSYIYCLLFGALISPTDPIAVMGILKQANAPKSLEVKIAGESLFNDGIGVVIFMVLLGIAAGGAEPTIASVALLFVQEAIGGIVYGLLIGYATFSMLRTVDNYQTEIMLTLALVMGGYALANALHLSGPIAMVVAGLLIGNHGRQHAMSDATQMRLDNFWELIDEILNAVLFVIIGLEVLVMSFQLEYILIALAIIPLVLGVRFVSVAFPVKLLSRLRSFSPRVIEIMTWGGLRGGISIALSLSLPLGPEREVILTITYLVVAFSILVQGLTIGQVVKGNLSMS